MAVADLYTNRLGRVLVVAPTPEGSLGHLVDERRVAFERGGDEVQRGATRWIFADVRRATLRDTWDNAYDHEVHGLLSGTLADGEHFLRELADLGFVVAVRETFFVPLQRLDEADQESSDRLRELHPRAFALARRDAPNARELWTAERNAAAFAADY